MKKYTLLALGDFSGYSESDIKDNVSKNYEVSRNELESYKFLIAQSDEGGYEGSSFFLVEKDGEFYENHASHCSCYGFEGQWKPEKTTLEYLTSKNFAGGGYYSTDFDSPSHPIAEYVKNLATPEPIKQPMGVGYIKHTLTIMDDEDANKHDTAKLKAVISELVEALQASEAMPSKSNDALIVRATALIN